MHPGVVVLLVPAADEQQPVLGRLGQRGPQPVEVTHDQRRCEVDPLVLRLQTLGHGRPERTEVDAGGVLPQLAPGDPAAGGHQGGQGERRAERHPGPLPQPRGQLRLPVQPGGHPCGQVAEDLPLVPGVRVLVEHRRGEARCVAHRQPVEDQVVVVALEHRGRRQDDVGVPGRLVEVDVDRRHEVQRIERLGQAPAVGGREHRVPGNGEHGPDLALTRCLDLLAEHRDGQLSGVLRQAADPAPPHVVVTRADEPPADRVDRWLGEQDPAFPVEVARQQVQALDRPLADRPEPVRGDAEPAVRRTPVGRGELARQPADDLGRQAAGRLRTLGGELRDRGRHPLHVVDVRRSRGETLGEQHLEHRQEHDRVAAGAHEVVLGGDLGGLGAPGVEDHHPAAALLQVAQPLREVGNGHEGAVGGHRVGPDDQEEGGPVDVRDRQQQLVAVELPPDELVGDLVDRGGAEAVAGAEALDEGQAVRRRTEGVGIGVAEVDPHRVRSVPVDRRGEAVGDPVQGLVPADLDPLGVRPLTDPADRSAQPVRVLEHVRERHPLGADVAPGERVLAVAADRGDAAIVDRQLEPADGFAQVADAQRGGSGHPDIVPSPGVGTCESASTGIACPHGTVQTGRPDEEEFPWDTDWVFFSWPSG